MMNPYLAWKWFWFKWPCGDCQRSAMKYGLHWTKRQGEWHVWGYVDDAHGL